MKKLYLHLLLIIGISGLRTQAQSQQLLSFAFLKANNPTLSTDVSLTSVSGYQLLTLPTGTDITALKASFTAATGSVVSVSGVAQTSDVTVNNFSSPVVYQVAAGNAAPVSYTIEVSVQVDVPAIESAVAAFMTKYDLPGVSIAIMKDERLVYAKGYGMANKEKGEPVTINSLFRVASVSKSITAMAALKLVDEGKLDLDQKVFGPGGILGTTYGTKPYNSQLQQITVRHLLSHTAGGDAWTNAWDPANNVLDPFYQKEWLNYTNEQVVSAVLDTRPVTQTPGSKFVYSNIGINIVGRIIEKVTGLKYEQYVQNNLLKPLGIDLTTMKMGGSTLAERVANEAVYYNPYTGYDQPYDFNVPRMDAHSGWITTAANLARLLAYTDGATGRKDILSAKRVQEMMTATPASLSASPAFGYGLGCYISTSSKATTHDGGMAGTSATWWRYPTGYTYVVLVNTRRGETSYYPDLELFLTNALFSGTPLTATLLMKGDQFNLYYKNAEIDKPTICTPVQRDAWSCTSTTGTIGIESVKIWSANKTSVLLDSKGVCSQNGNAYSDLTNQPAIALPKGAPIPFQLEAMKVQDGANKGNIYPVRVSIWIDLNQDQTYTENERVFVSTPSVAYPNPLLDGQFTVPNTALLGLTRMRIRAGTAFVTTPESACEQIDGETEDYLVNVGGLCSMSASVASNSSATICQGSSLSLTGSATGGQGTLSYSWQRDNTPLTEITNVLSVSTGGVYRFTATDPGSCSASSSLTVVVNARPQPTVSGSASICAGQVSVLTVSNTAGTGPFTYNWQQNQASVGTGSSLSATVSGNYVVTMTDANSCTGISSGFGLTVKPNPDAQIASVSLLSGGLASLSASPGGSGLTYQWLLSGTALTGATSATYTVRQSGSYRVMVTGDGCTGISAALVVNLPTSAGRLSTDASPTPMSMTIAPNPSSGQFIVQLRLPEPASATLSITNLLGQLVGQWHLEANRTDHEQPINLRSLPSGIYLITAESGAQRLVQRIQKE